MNKLNVKTKNNYRIFGFNVVSDFVLDEFLPGEESAQIEIINGMVPEEIINPIQKNSFFQASNREFLFNVENVAKFFVSNGNKIIIEAYEGADYSKIKSYLYGTSFQVLLLMRGLLALHGSAVVVEGKCIIISGVSGAGKSTLALALKEIGHSFLTDDVVFLSLTDDGTIWVYPGFPVHKLCKDSIDTIGIQMNSNSYAYLENEDKYFMPVTYGYQEAPVRLFGLWDLKPQACNEVCLTRLSGIQKLSVISNHTFRGKFISLFCPEVDSFRKLAFVAENIHIYQMIRPQKIFTIEKQIKLVLEEVINNRCSIIC